MGKGAAEEVVQSIGLYDNAAGAEYVASLGKKLAAQSERPNLPWSFQVVDDPVVNAFALPGGFIFVTRGLMAHMNSEAQLVSVLGHEIGHVTAKHSVQQISRAQLAQVLWWRACWPRRPCAALGEVGMAGPVGAVPEVRAGRRTAGRRPGLQILRGPRATTCGRCRACSPR